MNIEFFMVKISQFKKNQKSSLFVLQSVLTAYSYCLHVWIKWILCSIFFGSIFLRLIFGIVLLWYFINILSLINDNTTGSSHKRSICSWVLKINWALDNKYLNDKESEHKYNPKKTRWCNHINLFDLWIYSHFQ